MDSDGIKQLTLEEGTVLFVYDDASGQRIMPGTKVIGHPTIGTGRALDVHGISSSEAAFLFDDDLAQIEAQLGQYTGWDKLNTVRQFVIVDMTFNIGFAGVLRFKKMITALKAGDFSQAATEMLASGWAEQLPTRAHRLAEMMRTGVRPAAADPPKGEPAAPHGAAPQVT